MAKCTDCGFPNAYIGFNSIECENPKCKNFKPKEKKICGCGCGQVNCTKNSSGIGSGIDECPVDEDDLDLDYYTEQGGELKIGFYGGFGGVLLDDVRKITPFLNLYENGLVSKNALIKNFGLDYQQELENMRYGKWIEENITINDCKQTYMIYNQDNY